MSTELPRFGAMPMFAKRETIEEAGEYLDTLASSVRKSDKIALYTGAYVLYNTLANEANIELEKAEAIIAAREAEIDRLTTRLEEIKRDGYVQNFDKE